MERGSRSSTDLGASASTDEGLSKRAARGVFWAAAGNWGTQLSAFVVFAVLSRLLEPKAFGLVALASVFVGFVQVIASQGLLDALVQRKEVDRTHFDTAFWMSLGFSTLLAGLIAVIAFPLSDALGQPELAPVLAVLSLGLPISAAGLVQRAILARRLDFRGLSLRMLVASLVGAVCGVTAALFGCGVWSLVIQNLTNLLAGTVIVWRVSAWRPGLGLSRRHFRELFGFGASVVGFRTINYFNRRADDLLIGMFLGPVALGLYTVAYRVLILLIEVTSSLIDTVAFPVFSRIQDDVDRLRRAYYTATGFAALLVFPAFIGLMVTAPQTVEVLFGPKWAGSVPVMRVLSLFGIIQSLNYFNSTMLVSLGKPAWRIGIVGVTAVLNVTGFFIAVQFGIVWVAVSLVVVSYVTAPMSFWALNRLVPVDARTYLANLRTPALATLGMAGCLIALGHVMGEAPAIAQLAVLVPSGVLLYVGLITVLDRALAVRAHDVLRQTLPIGRRPATQESR